MKCRVTNRFCRAAYFSRPAPHPELVKKQEVQRVFGKPLVKSYRCILIANGSSPTASGENRHRRVDRISVGAGAKKK